MFCHEISNDVDSVIEVAIDLLLGEPDSSREARIPGHVIVILYPVILQQIAGILVDVVKVVIIGTEWPQNCVHDLTGFVVVVVDLLLDQGS